MLGFVTSTQPTRSAIALLEAGVRHERTLEAVSSTPLLGVVFQY